MEKSINPKLSLEQFCSSMQVFEGFTKAGRMAFGTDLALGFMCGKTLPNLCANLDQTVLQTKPTATAAIGGGHHPRSGANKHAGKQQVNEIPLLPQSWKWKITPIERKPILEGPIFYFHVSGKRATSAGSVSKSPEGAICHASSHLAKRAGSTLHEARLRTMLKKL